MFGKLIVCQGKNRLKMGAENDFLLTETCLMRTNSSRRVHSWDFKMTLSWAALHLDATHALQTSNDILCTVLPTCQENVSLSPA